MLIIRDQPSRFASLSEVRLQERLGEFQTQRGVTDQISEHTLMEPHYNIVRVVDEVLSQGPIDLIVDLTSMPKRFFFPILRRLLDNPNARSILAAYTIPQGYTAEHLSENHNDWAHLPLFSGGYPAPPPEMLIVSVGFEALGLLDQIDQSYQGIPVKLLVPFPAPIAAFSRSMELTSRIQRYRSQADFTSLRTDARDASDAYTRLVSLTSGARSAILAPFGPKPVSLAMCIFAAQTNSEVFYCQPTVYHPDYSTGVSVVNGRAETYVYCIRLIGHDYYALPDVPSPLSL